MCVCVWGWAGGGRSTWMPVTVWIFICRPSLLIHESIGLVRWPRLISQSYNIIINNFMANQFTFNPHSVKFRRLQADNLFVRRRIQTLNLSFHTNTLNSFGQQHERWFYSVDNIIPFDFCSSIPDNRDMSVRNRDLAGQGEGPIWQHQRHTDSSCHIGCHPRSIYDDIRLYGTDRRHKGADIPAKDSK